MERITRKLLLLKLKEVTAKNAENAKNSKESQRDRHGKHRLWRQFVPFRLMEQERNLAPLAVLILIRTSAERWLGRMFQRRVRVHVVTLIPLDEPLQAVGK